MGINNPIPRSLKAETKKAAKVLASFVKPNQLLGADEVIPPHVLKTARGLAIITVLKAGFLFSGRAGSGVIVARLPDGSWSAPSAIAMAGAGAGGMIGFELTDFVFILNTADAVKSFSQLGSITLGGNISVAAGPLGRNAEAAATASLGGIAAIFAYSKTKGLFAGVSVEGSVIFERRDANRKFYGSNCSASTILSGKVNAPPGADPLFRVLQSRVFNSGRDNGMYANDDDFYGDLPSNFESDDTSTRERDISRKNSKYSYYDESDEFDATWDTRPKGKNASAYSDYAEDLDGFGFTERPKNGNYSGRSNRSHQKSSHWEDDIYDRDVDDVSDRLHKTRISSGDAPSRPTTKKPDMSFGTVSNTGRAPSSNHRAPSSGLPKAVALYTFKGEQKGDLPFRKGEVISILKRSESQDDWWTGRINGQEGIFPANYVELV